MIDFEWNIQQIKEGIERQVFQYRAVSLLRPHENIWPNNPNDVNATYDLLPDQIAKSQFLAVCLASYLLSPYRAPEQLLKWIEDKSSVSEILGCDTTLDEIMAWRWDRAAFPVVDPNENDSVYYAMIGCHQNVNLHYFPDWAPQVLHNSALEAVKTSLYVAKKTHPELVFFFWPFVDSKRQLHGRSITLPLYLSYMTLAAGNKIPVTRIATGDISSHEGLSVVSGISRKYDIAKSKGFTHFIYPADDSHFEVASDLLALPASTLFEAEEKWGVTRPKIPTLIPSLSALIKKMPIGARDFAHRIESKLRDDSLCWYNLPILGQKNIHPDFIILNPHHGLMVIQVIDWELADVIACNQDEIVIGTSLEKNSYQNPLAQAKKYTEIIIDILKADPQLACIESGTLQLSLTYGVVFSSISRSQFSQHTISENMEGFRTICKDEMVASVDPLTFQKRLWQMFDSKTRQTLSLRQIERIRWHIFPEIRILPSQNALNEKCIANNDSKNIPDITRVMDLQQENLARSLGEGHRVIHGVAGSGKTMILVSRALHLAESLNGPILVLCYNKLLSLRLQKWLKSAGASQQKVSVMTFHAWCLSMITKYHLGSPNSSPGSGRYFDEIIQIAARGVRHNIIKIGQYDAILIDEGHDFQPEWFKLIVQMVNPQTNSLLVLYDDAQSIYATGNGAKINFKSVGIKAVGRTKILKINYRNTQDVLECASTYAAQILRPQESDEDSAPIVKPVSAGRRGPAVDHTYHLTLADEAQFIASKLLQANSDGLQWHEMAVLYNHRIPTGKAIEDALRTANIPYVLKEDVSFNSKVDQVLILPYQSSKGLEFELVAIPCAEMPTNSDEAKLLYVALTRSLSQLVLTSKRSADTSKDDSNLDESIESNTYENCQRELNIVLTSRQKQAVEHGEGPLLIHGGPGTGKTLVVTHRISHLITVREISPRSILAVTFSLKAATDIKEQVRFLLSSNNIPLVTTFHGLCTIILRKDIRRLGYDTSFTMCVGNDRDQLLKDVIAEMNLDEQQFVVGTVAEQIDNFKNHGLFPEDIVDLQDSDVYKRKIVDIYAAYQERIKICNKLDFGDLLIQTVRLLTLFPEICNSYREQFQWLLVDEFQDTNQVQYQLLQLLAGVHKNICVAGDSNQTIYSWRGSDTYSILNFCNDFPNYTEYRCEQNYRSTNVILKAADAVLTGVDPSNEIVKFTSRIINRKKNGEIVEVSNVSHSTTEVLTGLSSCDYRQLTLVSWTKNPDGVPIQYKRLETDREEARFVATEILKLQKMGLKLFEMAVFYRTHTQSRLLEEALRIEGIPYHTVSFQNLFSRPEIKDVLAYIRLVNDPSDIVSLDRIFNSNLPPHGIGGVTLQRVIKIAISEQITLMDSLELATTLNSFSDATKSKIVIFVRLISRLTSLSKNMNLPMFIRTVIKESGYIEYINRMFTTQHLDKLQSIEQLISKAEYLYRSNPNVDISDFILQIESLDEFEYLESGSNAVSLMSLHASKSMEFDVVFMIGVEERLLPFIQAFDDLKSMEEERRLCYVGMTRARKRLYLLNAQHRYLFGQDQCNPPSRFINDIPSEYLLTVADNRDISSNNVNDLAHDFFARMLGETESNSDALNNKAVLVGMKVQHAKFGMGTIRKIEGEGEDQRVIVWFNLVGPKKLVLKYAGLVEV